MDGIELREFLETDADWLVEAHGRLYAQKEGFDDSFAPLVAGILRDHFASRDPARERGWLAARGSQRLGSVFCVSAGGDLAKLRLFLVEPSARGKGLGQRLLDECLSFARARGYRRMTLWTHKSHAAAGRLYARAGFSITAEKPVRAFGADLIDQTWEIDL